MISTIQTAIINTLSASTTTMTVGSERQIMAPPCVGVYWLGPGYMVAHEVQPTRSQRFELSFYANPGNGNEGMTALRLMCETVVDALFASHDLGLTNVLRLEIEGQSMSKPDIVDKATCVRLPITVHYHE